MQIIVQAIIFMCEINYIKCNVKGHISFKVTKFTTVVLPGKNPFILQGTETVIQHSCITCVSVGFADD